MADNTPIEWADATVNAINGCTRVSPGCGGPGNAGACYAERLAATRLKNVPSREGLATMTAKGPRWTGKVSLHEPALLQPLRWQRPRTIFWNAHGDTFHEAVPDEWIDRMFAVMALTPQHRHLVLTKRAARMSGYFADGTWALRVSQIINAWPDSQIGTGNEYIGDLWLMKRGAIKNVWLGTSAEDQPRLDERIGHLIKTPSAFGRYLSLEPLLGPIKFPRVNFHCDLCGGTGMLARWPRGSCHICYGRGFLPAFSTDPKFGTPSVPARRIDGVIVGGESGPGARPMHPDWARSIRDDCAAAGVDFHFKQWGAHSPLRSDLIPVARHNIGWVQHDGHVEYGVSEDRAYAMAEAERKADRSLFTMMCRVGKKAAGRTLDGVTHDASPWSSTTA